MSVFIDPRPLALFMVDDLTHIVVRMQTNGRIQRVMRCSLAEVGAPFHVFDGTEVATCIPCWKKYLCGSPLDRRIP